MVQWRVVGVRPTVVQVQLLSFFAGSTVRAPPRCSKE